MNLKNKLGLVVGALTLTASIGLGSIGTHNSTDVARNDLPMEYAFKNLV